MTMPIERMRALRWAGQLLREMQVDPLVLPEMQHRAAKLSCSYPNKARLLEILSEPGERFPRELATVLFDAGRLFESMDVPGQMSRATRDLLRGTMRHFPSRFNGWHRPDDFELFRADELLEAEDGINHDDTADTA